MAVRARTLEQARELYQTNGELVWWVFMRVSGLALIFLVFGHLFFNNIQVNAGDIDYDYVAFTEVNLERFERAWDAVAR